ncbi:MAG: hypothetical protein D6722_00145 [Bacteroidetes bacterium]|nr:MAG: hypothetical protein D6722_00145 [Bacteroidota bacterium]
MPDLSQVVIGDERFFVIHDINQLRPFFMNIVSESDHWMFISSNGGLTAGRRNAEFALFPYYTDDKITESVEVTGSKSIFRVQRAGATHLWEPFSIRGEGLYRTSQNLYKHEYGHQVIFEEINHDLGLSFRYRWSSGDTFGFVREASLHNRGTDPVEVDFLDGLQNIVPAGVGSYTQNNFSNLVDAYKRSELHEASGLGIFALSAIIVDKAEPSEALKANVVWSMGLGRPTYLLSSRQLPAFRATGEVAPEHDVKGEKGAYFVHDCLSLAAGAEKSWSLIANVNQSHADVIGLIHRLSHDRALGAAVAQDVDQGTRRLKALNASADALQCTADPLRDARHFSNVLFNIMRGGIFDHHYRIEKWDFVRYLAKANQAVYAAQADFVNRLPETFTVQALREALTASQDPDLQRLSLEYMPLKFSRRHGDPSRPWNRFSINTRSETDGSKVLDYEGNWRDIFQNWEALVHAFPDFIEGMIAKFLNASTFDGYNPYRVTKDGFDWETIEPDDPWSYIGYWGDHQIIYLLKFLEFLEVHQPGRLQAVWNQATFVYANVPYRIKPYADLLRNPKDTIDFDHVLDGRIRARREAMGADGALLTNQAGDIHRVSFMEKILATVLAKLSNFIPEGGIWMNTQRPEWNDANNALVGNGVSMVTLCYLRRFLHFFQKTLQDTSTEGFEVSEEMATFFAGIRDALVQHRHLLDSAISDQDRKRVLDALGLAGSAYREQIYEQAFSAQRHTLSRDALLAFLDTSLAFVDHSIAANRREDDLYHAYNLMTVYDGGVRIDYLNEMLEGQVAVLSSGYLKPEEVLAVLDGMKESPLFRPDQYSYLLYPNKELPGFLARNNIPASAISRSQLLKKMVAEGHKALVEQDVEGGYHFNPNFKNAGDLDRALRGLAGSPYAGLAAQERDLILGIFEEVFNHKAFTGRSGTFYGYEGLGSIYWHMVSKLLLAVNECCLSAIGQGSDPETVGRLLEHYYEIQAGIGVHKSPELYGAFPTDAYSHTPAGKGAQQPGMTGQVKEDILSRIGELGVKVVDGCIHFEPALLRRSEFLAETRHFAYINLAGETHTLELPVGSLAFTYCQVPVVYHLAQEPGLTVHYADGSHRQSPEAALDLATSQAIFRRSGEVTQVEVWISPQSLK